MLERLGFKHFAYDWRAEHIPTFDAEIEALKRHGVSLDAFWVAPGELNRESRIILDVLKRHGVKAQLWVLLDLGGDRVDRRRAGAAGRGRGGQAPAAGRGGRQDRLLAGPVQPRRLVRRAGEPDRDHRAAARAGGHERRHRLQPAPRPRAPRPVRRAAREDEALPRGAQPQRHGPGRRPGRAEDPAAGPGVARPGAAADHPRQRLSRPDRHPRPHPWTTPRSGCATTSTASTGSSPSSTASRPARGPKPRTPVPPPAREPARLRPPTPRRSPRCFADARSARRSRPRGRRSSPSPKFACLSCHRVGEQGARSAPT